MSSSLKYCHLFTQPEIRNLEKLFFRVKVQGIESAQNWIIPYTKDNT